MSEFDIGTRYFPFNITGITNQATPTPITYPKVGKIIGNSTATAITGGISNTVTLAGPLGCIQIGTKIKVTNGGVTENVIVTAVNSATPSFTAVFLNSYSGTTYFNSVTPSLLGAVIVNNPGTTSVLTLYNGFPNGTPNGVKIATITLASGEQVRPYACFVEFGLFYTLSSSGAPDVTAMYRDDPQGR